MYTPIRYLLSDFSNLISDSQASSKLSEKSTVTSVQKILPAEGTSSHYLPHIHPSHVFAHLHPPMSSHLCTILSSHTSMPYHVIRRHSSVFSRTLTILRHHVMHLYISSCIYIISFLYAFALSHVLTYLHPPMS